MIENHHMRRVFELHATRLGPVQKVSQTRARYKKLSEMGLNASQRVASYVGVDNPNNISAFVNMWSCEDMRLKLGRKA